MVFVRLERTQARKGVRLGSQRHRPGRLPASGEIRTAAIPRLTTRPTGGGATPHASETAPCRGSSAR
jgi:hypothetical protein